MLRFPLGCALAALAAAPAIAQVPAGPEFQVNTVTTGDQLISSAALDRLGRLTVAWDQDVAAPLAVAAQHFLPSGARVGGEFQVNTTPGGTLPALAVRKLDGLVAAWYAYDGIRAQRYAPSWQAEGAEFRVNTYTTQTQYTPSVAPLPGGGFVVAWLFSGLSVPHRILVRRFDAHGSALGDEVLASGSPAGGVFENFPAVASAADGRFVVVWRHSESLVESIRARRFDASGNPLDTPFEVNALPLQGGRFPRVAMADEGTFVVVWNHSAGDGDLEGIRARLFTAAGTPVAGEFTANAGTSGRQFRPAVAAGDLGDFVVTWTSGIAGAYDVLARRFESNGTPRSGDFRVNTYTTGRQYGEDIASDGVGNFVVTWSSQGQDGSGWGVFGQRFGGLLPVAMDVDTAAAPQADGNRVLEPSETVDVRPWWRNETGALQPLSGALSGFGGPPGATYAITDAVASYGIVPGGGASGTCGDCYAVTVSAPTQRPLRHWDTWARERLAPDAQGQQKLWYFHVGDTFTDVARSSPYYRFVETLVHNYVTAGCTEPEYCPQASTTREQMSVFVLVSRDRAGDPPPLCAAAVFNDVPVSSPYCRWIEELARAGVVTGCGGGNFCPSAPVSREQMAVFVLRTFDPALDPPACATPMFADVPASSPFCRWIEELARRGVVTGCGAGNYCPTDPVTREQMAVFLTGAFGLRLYGE